MGILVREGLRRYVSASYCRIKFPWVDDGNKSLEKFRRAVTYNLRPPAPWYALPIIALAWFALVILSSIEVLRQHGVHVARRESIPQHIQLSRMMVRAFRHNLSPHSFYHSRLGQKRQIEPYTESLPCCEMRFYYDRIYGKVDSDLLDRKDRFFEFCHQHSLPTVPIIYIAYGERSRQDEPKLPRRDLFSKPLNAFAGQGVALWTYDPDTDTWSSDNKSLPENDLIDYLNRLAENQPLMFAQILQPRVLNHPAVSGLSLRSLNTARIMTFRAKEAAPQIGISQFRMASDTSIVDTLHWYIASIETDTGRLGIGVSPNPSFPNCRVHPATGHAIEGVMLPQWQVAVQLVLRAHELAPPLPIIGWDVAFTPVGPLLVEANTCAVVKYVQLANGKSLATPEVVDALLSWLD